MNKILVAITLSFILSLGCAMLADASGKIVFVDSAEGGQDWSRAPTADVELQKRAATTWSGVKCDVPHRIY